MIEAQQPQSIQPGQYTPAGPPDPLVFEDFEGINTATLRPGVDDKQAAWLDNFMPLGPRRNLRTMWGIGPALFTVDFGLGDVAFFDFFNIQATPWMLVVTTTGAIFVVNTDTTGVTQIAASGTIQNPSRQTVGISQWGNQYVLIVAQQTNGYFIWDGSGFHLPGGPAPGSGTMPLGIAGSAIEVYAGRVWIANTATITFSAPGSFIDFSSANGGGNFTSTDSFLRVQFTQLKQTNGFLYLIADSSVNYISGVQTSGTGPAITTFTNQNADPEVGSPWPATVNVFNRNILFANPFGAQVSYGGAVTKISEALDGVYNSVPNFGNFFPSAGKAIIFGKRCWILLLPIIDPIKSQQVNKLLLWNGKIWWAAEQDVPMVYIQSQEINSVLTCYGTNGRSIYRLFNQPSVAIEKIAQSRLWDKPGGYQFQKWVTRLWGIVQYYNPLSPTVTVSIDNEVGTASSTATVPTGVLIWLNALGQQMTWTNRFGQTMVWSSTGAIYSVFSPEAVAQHGVLTGMTVRTNAADLALVSAMMQDTIASNRG